ncbi:MAG: penicillin-binding protein 2 [Alphaproteobacteria bacterium]|nr:MAG: penicillin-binding protein 2 [Alphaproteobacteria bacterium]
MNNKQDSHHLLTRRMALVGAGKIALFATLLARLFHLQVIQRQHYRNLAEGNRIKITPLTPVRGEIFDRQGKSLASNRPTYFLQILPEDVPSLTEALALITSLTSLRFPDYAIIQKRVRSSPKFLPVTISEDLSWSDVCAIEVNLHRLPGFSVEAGHLRSYPYDKIFSHVIGHVHLLADGQKSHARFRKIPNLHVGKTGIEKQRDDELLGTPGIRETEVNAHRREIRDLSLKPSIPGESLILTLNRDLQVFVYEKLQSHQSGSCVVIDVTNGDILALVSAPGFDPNVFSTGISTPHWKELLSNPAKPLMDKVMSGLYPPGSIFKFAVALAALEDGIKDLHVSCTGKFSYGSHIFHCWKKTGHGLVDYEKALQHSCDTFFYVLAQKLGHQKIYNAAHKLGFGSKSGLDFPNEKSGLLPTPAWKRATYHQPWTGGDTINMSIGQGYLQATPIQLALTMARLSSGKNITARLYKTPDAPAPPPLNAQPEHLSLIRKGLWLSVSDWGTGWRLGQKFGSTDVFAKTSTAQVKRITQKERDEGIKNADLPWELRDHAMIVAAAPYSNPRFAMAVVIDHGGGGGSVAAPFAGEVLRKIITLTNTTP